MSGLLTPALLHGALARALEFALERALALDPHTQAGLAALDGREVVMALQAPALRARLRVQDGRIRIGPDRVEREPDLSLSASLGAVLAQLLPGRGADALPVGQVRISGDAELARRLQQLVQRYAPDFEEAFARTFGDVLGVPLARAVRGAFEGLREGAVTLARDSADFLAEESRDLVPRGEMESFYDDVDDLRDAVERAERRLARMGLRTS